ncbi:hypothetical protein [Aestuariirhabdus sp. LZHN29]|uniref:hypothetical protein n=1 Tax=Aestuariirhabdus sp. LZHN29 TaxID=3417462 RepID=UPI003CF53857
MDQGIDFSVVAFGETEQFDFPLIMVFGRESNGSNKVIPGVSIYDETVSSRSTFWNRSLTFIQRCASSKLHLRRECIKRNAGPVLFTNAIPHPILNAESDKDCIRAAVDSASIEEHILSVFNLDIAKRVKVVVFSTGPGEKFDVARNKVKEFCLDKGIVLIDVPYFATQGGPNAVIDQSISVEQKEFIKSVIDAYYLST